MEVLPVDSKMPLNKKPILVALETELTIYEYEYDQGYDAEDPEEGSSSNKR